MSGLNRQGSVLIVVMYRAQPAKAPPTLDDTSQDILVYPTATGIAQKGSCQELNAHQLISYTLPPARDPEKCNLLICMEGKKKKKKQLGMIIRLYTDTNQRDRSHFLDSGYQIRWPEVNTFLI